MKKLYLYESTAELGSWLYQVLEDGQELCGIQRTPVPLYQVNRWKPDVVVVLWAGRGKGEYDPQEFVAVWNLRTTFA